MPEEQGEQLKDMLKRILDNAQNSLDTQSFVETQKLNSYVTIPSNWTQYKPLKQLVGLKTDTFLDNKFFDETGKSINGIPFGTSTIITGLPNSGKSVFMEELALRLAYKGIKVCYAITEEIFASDGKRYDLQTRLIKKANVLKLDWCIIANNLFVLDAVAHPELRDWRVFVASYKGLVEDEKVSTLLIDSMTLLEDSRGQVKYRVLELVRYNQLHDITSFMITQRAVEEADNMALAGGIALSYSVDSVIALDYKKLSSWDAQLKQDTNCKQGDTINFMHILKCRVCRFDSHYFQYIINNDGVITQVSTTPNNI